MMRSLSLFLGSLILFTTEAAADGRRTITHRHWEFSVFGGASFLGEHSYPTPVVGSNQEASRDVGLRFATGPQYGVRISETLGQHWGATFEYAISNQGLEFSDFTASHGTLGLGHSIHRFTYEILYYPYDRLHRFRPFVLAGPGLSLFHVAGSAKSAAAAHGVELDSPWKFTFSWGAGLKYLVWDQIAVNLQYTDTISGVPSYGLPRAGMYNGTQYTPGVAPDGYLHNSLISLGFVYQWGQK